MKELRKQIEKWITFECFFAQKLTENAFASEVQRSRNNFTQRDVTSQGKSIKGKPREEQQVHYRIRLSKVQSTRPKTLSSFSRKCWAILARNVSNHGMLSRSLNRKEQFLWSAFVFVTFLVSKLTLSSDFFHCRKITVIYFQFAWSFEES